MTRHRSHNTGQALIETALVLPVVLRLFAIIYGFYINAVDAVQQAVRVGVHSRHREYTGLSRRLGERAGRWHDTDCLWRRGRSTKQQSPLVDNRHGIPSQARHHLCRNHRQ
ncbi:MAG: hypothetical protein C7B43_09690 [Sulfobacillus benefaciens]|uniref:TadE-like domain-containing protein n=1 Tax=Sulfobacillus benefaciens TaxID=453960 RepID=A0A2T2X2J3_9FIRM|nr:MAG: hypothetical protein C7B43_09690 [Sulfobacillus benefaciens]